MKKSILRRPSNWILISLLFALLSAFHSATALSKELGINDYISLVKENDAEIEKIIQQKAQTRFNVDLNLPTSSWLFSVSNIYGFASQMGGRTSDLTASLSRDYRETGTSISLNYNENELADRNEKIQSIRLQQDLIQNAFGLQTRLFKGSLEAQNKTTELQLIESYEDYIAEKTLSYIDLIDAFESYNTSKNLLKDIKSVFADVKKRKEKSVALNVDLDRAEAEVIRYERRKLEAEFTLSQIRKDLFGRINSNEINFDKVYPQKIIPFIDNTTEFEQLEDNFFKNSRTVKIMEYNKKNNDLDIKAQKRNLYPELNFILGRSIDESTRFATTVNREETVVGLNLVYEFNNSLEKARLSESEYNLNVQRIDNFSIINNVKSEFIKLKEQITIQKKRVSLLKKQSKILNRLIRNEKKRFDRGLLSLRDLIETQNEYTQVQYDLIKQQVNLAKTYVTLKQLTDTLITDPV